MQLLLALAYKSNSEAPSHNQRKHCFKIFVYDLLLDYVLNKSSWWDWIFLLQCTSPGFLYRLIRGIKPERKTLLCLTGEHAALYFCWHSKSTSLSELLCPHVSLSYRLVWCDPFMCNFCMSYIVNVCPKHVIVTVIVWPSSTSSYCQLTFESLYSLVTIIPLSTSFFFLFTHACLCESKGPENFLPNDINLVQIAKHIYYAYKNEKVERGLYSCILNTWDVIICLGFFWCGVIVGCLNSVSAHCIRSCIQVFLSNMGFVTMQQNSKNNVAKYWEIFLAMIPWTPLTRVWR